MARRRGTILFAGLLAALAGTAAAHDTLGLQAWCGGGRLQLLGEFQIGPGPLAAFRDADACPSGGGPKNCGQFDDDYYVARTYSASYCVQAYPEIAQSSELIGLRAEIVGPAPFLSDNHHAAYHVGQGVQGFCVACLAPPAASDPGGGIR